MTPKETNIPTSKVEPVAPANAQPRTPFEPIGFSPFRTLERLADDVTRFFDDFGLVRGWRRPADPADVIAWSPRVDVTQDKGELVVRADLPGMKKGDVSVNVAEDVVTIRGERHREHEEEREGVYRSERHYGAFYRTIALPPGSATDQAKASLKDGVLLIRIPTAPGAKGRRVEIGG